MYLLLSRNNPYLEELNKNLQGQEISKDFEGMEIDLKNRFKSKDSDIKENYNVSNLSSETFTDYEDISNDTSISAKLKSSQIDYEPNVKGNKLYIKKITLFKYYIHIFEISSSILIILSAILCQIEDDKFYDKNLYTRVVGSLLINYINTYGPNDGFEIIFNDSRVNLTNLLEYNGNSISTLTNYLIHNSFNFNENITNLDILKSHNLSHETYSFIIGETKYQNIKIPLEISEKDQNLRYAILIISLISGFFLLAARYLSFYREERLRKETGLPFYKSKYCLILFFEILYMLILPYPSLKLISIYAQLDNVIVLPLSSFFNSLSSFRFLYIFQMLNAISIWDNVQSEQILDKYSINASLIFSMKAQQKSNPFIFLLFLFFTFCISFGLCVRIFELYYWESQTLFLQNWRFRMNGIWCVFISMTTVGYGDFFPKTHFGRGFIIISCVIGIYFVSMMMIFMTQKSILTESEQKAYKLITRLKTRNQLKDTHSNIIYHSLRMMIISAQYKNHIMTEKQFEIVYNYEKRCIIYIIDQNKILSEKIKSFDIIPTKDQLFDISERIDIDIKEIKSEVDILQKMNTSFVGYTDTQVIMIKYLKKCIQNSKLMFDLLERKPSSFGDLAHVNKDEVIESLNKIYNEHITYIENMDNVNINTNLKIEKLFEDKTNNTNSNSNFDEFYANELEKYQVTQEEFKSHFHPLFFDTSDQAVKAMKNNALKTIKTIKQMKEMKKKIDSALLRRRNGGDKGDTDNSVTEQYLEDEID